VENSKLSPICCGLLSTFSSLKRSERPHPMVLAFEKLDLSAPKLSISRNSSVRDPRNSPVVTVFCQLCGQPGTSEIRACGHFGQPVSRRGFDGQCAVRGERKAGIVAAFVIRQAQVTGFGKAENPTL